MPIQRPTTHRYSGTNCETAETCKLSTDTNKEGQKAMSCRAKTTDQMLQAWEKEHGPTGAASRFSLEALVGRDGAGDRFID